MSDPHFFSPQGPFTAEHLAFKLSASLHGENCPLKDINILENSSEGELSFVEKNSLLPKALACKASALLVREEMASSLPMTCLVCDDPRQAFAYATQIFYPPRIYPPGVHPSAVVESTAVVPDTCFLGPGVVIGAGVSLGEHVVVEANTVIDYGVSVGAHSVIHACCYLGFCHIGKHVCIQEGARIGGEGFGFVPTEKEVIPIAQVGSVLIEDYVSIGCNSTIDRGLQNTVIAQGTRIDNLVMIGHGVRVGRGCLLAAQVGVGGSSVLGDRVLCGGQVGIKDKVTVGEGAIITGGAKVLTETVPAHSKFCTFPAEPFRSYVRKRTLLETLSRRKGGRNDGRRHESDLRRD